jgi:hypothetical protein
MPADVSRAGSSESPSQPCKAVTQARCRAPAASVPPCRPRHRSRQSPSAFNFATRSRGLQPARPPDAKASRALLNSTGDSRRGKNDKRAPETIRHLRSLCPNANPSDVRKSPSRRVAHQNPLRQAGGADRDDAALSHRRSWAKQSFDGHTHGMLRLRVR